MIEFLVFLRHVLLTMAIGAGTVAVMLGDLWLYLAIKNR